MEFHGLAATVAAIPRPRQPPFHPLPPLGLNIRSNGRLACSHLGSLLSFRLKAIQTTKNAPLPLPKKYIRCVGPPIEIPLTIIMLQLAIPPTLRTAYVEGDGVNLTDFIPSSGFLLFPPSPPFFGWVGRVGS